MTTTALSMPSELSQWRPPGRPPQVLAAPAAPAPAPRSLPTSLRHQNQQKSPQQQQRQQQPLPSHTTAPVLEFRCLYTYDIRRKAKRWQDGFLRFHTFNRRVMVYDVPRNFIGDTHWSGYGAGGNGGDVIEEGDELKLDSGILVEVAEAVGKMETDLSGLIRRRTVPKEARGNDMEISGSGMLYSGSGAVAAATHRYNEHRPARGIMQEQQPELQTQTQAQRKHKSLSSLLGTPKGPHGRAVLPKQSPYDVRNDCHEYGSTGREAKRQRIDGQSLKENVYPYTSCQTVPSSPLAGRGEGRKNQCAGIQNMRPSEKDKNVPTYIGPESVPSSPLQSVHSRQSPNYERTKIVAEISQRSNSPCPTSPTRKLSDASARDKNDRVTGTRNEQGRKLQPQTLRIGTAKPRKMLLTESISCQIDEQSSHDPEKSTETASENDRNATKRQRRERPGHENGGLTATSHISNVPDEHNKQKDEQSLQEINKYSSRPKKQIIRQGNSDVNNAKINEPDSTFILPTSPPLRSPDTSYEASRADNNVAKNTKIDTEHTSAKGILPEVNPSKRKPMNTSRSPPLARTRQAEDNLDTTKIAPLNSNIPPVTTTTTTSINVNDTTTASTTAKTHQPSTNKHLSTLHRPFRRVRSVSSNTNGNANTNTNGNEYSQDNDVENKIDDKSSARPKAKTRVKTANGTTGTTTIMDADNDNDNNIENDNPPDLPNHRENNILSSSPALLSRPASSPQLQMPDREENSTKENPEEENLSAIAMPTPVPMPMPIAEETGPWSVEALDLFDWRPPDWRERMERVRQERMQIQMQLQR